MHVTEAGTKTPRLQDSKSSKEESSLLILSDHQIADLGVRASSLGPVSGMLTLRIRSWTSSIHSNPLSHHAFMTQVAKIRTSTLRVANLPTIPEPKIPYSTQLPLRGGRSSRSSSSGSCKCLLQAVGDLVSAMDLSRESLK